MLENAAAEGSSELRHVARMMRDLFGEERGRRSRSVSAPAHRYAVTDMLLQISIGAEPMLSHLLLSALRPCLPNLLP